MTIEVNQGETALFTQVGAICTGETLSPLPTTSTNGYTGSWSPAMDNTATTFYTFTSDAGQCANDTTMTIVVNLVPVVADFVQVAPICSGDDLSPLPTTSTNGFTGTWSPAIDNTTTTVYTFTADADQCAADTIMTIEVNDCSSRLLIPNVFTPNGDGANDFFTVDSENLIGLEMDIYNRWGQMLYSWDNIKGAWDGRTSAGNEVPEGTYFYVAKIIDANGEGYVQKGTFSLVR